MPGGGAAERRIYVRDRVGRFADTPTGGRATPEAGKAMTRAMLGGAEGKKLREEHRASLRAKKAAQPRRSGQHSLASQNKAVMAKLKPTTTTSEVKVKVGTGKKKTRKGK